MRYIVITIFILLIPFFGCHKKGLPESTGVIKGRVVYSLDGNISGYPDAVVSAVQETTIVKSDTTDSLGCYLLCDLYPGIYDVFIASPPIAVGDTVKDIEVKSDDTTNIRDLDSGISMVSTGAIKGRVIYYFGGDISGYPDAVVSAVQETTIVKSDTTDSLGYYLLGDIYPGFYDVFIASPPIAVGDTVKDVEVKGNDTTEIRDLDTGIEVDKPNIYLYPPCPMNVTIKLVFHHFGTVTSSEPEYKNGWDVFVEPEGLINLTYNFLFYEAKVPNIWQRECGWLVQREHLAKWLWEYLPLYGFNEKETSDFVKYWTLHLPLSNFYIFYPQNSKRVEQVVSLYITPQPDQILRIWFLIEPVNEPKTVKEAYIPSFERIGFTVTEWGVLGLPIHH